MARQGHHRCRFRRTASRGRCGLPRRAPVRLLLDTHALLWWLADEGLTTHARDAIADPANIVMVSAVSAWEISIKKALGKLAAPDDLEHQVQAGGFVPLPISIGHGIAAGALARPPPGTFPRQLSDPALLGRRSRFGNTQSPFA